MKKRNQYGGFTLVGLLVVIAIGGCGGESAGTVATDDEITAHVEKYGHLAISPEEMLEDSVSPEEMLEDSVSPEEMERQAATNESVSVE